MACACKASSKGLPGAVCDGCVPAVLGVCRESMCRERACVGCGSCVPRVCRVCAAGCVLGVCRECAGLCRPSVLGGCAVCRVCAGSVRVYRVCAGVFVGGVWAVWPVLEQ